MTPQAVDSLARARNDLSDARKIAAIGIAKVAARLAYYAAFHAAEAMIVERTGKIAKTHSGVRAEFARLTQGSPAADRRLARFLAEGYQYKEISDYGIGNTPEITQSNADDAIVRASTFIDWIAAAGRALTERRRRTSL